MKKLILTDDDIRFIELCLDVAISEGYDDRYYGAEEALNKIKEFIANQDKEADE